jgi:HK97 family phage portal protein
MTGTIERLRSSDMKQRAEPVADRAVPSKFPIVSSYYTAPQAITTQWPYYVLVNCYKGWEYTTIDKIAKTIAMIPLKLFIYRRSGKKFTDTSWKASYKALKTEGDRKYFLKDMDLEKVEIKEHPFLQLMKKPNDVMTRFGLWYESIMRLELGGVCGWLKLKDKLGVPRQVIPLPLTQFALLRPKVSPSFKLDYWDYQDGDIKTRFQPDEVCLFKYPHPASPFQGMSPLMAQSYAYDIDLFLLQQQRALFKNSAIPGLIMNTDQQLSPDAVRELQEQFSDKYEGAMQAGKTLVGHSGLKFDKLMGISGRDAMVDVIGQWVREKIVTSHDVSLSKIGIHERDNRATAEVADLTYTRECIEPKTMLAEEVLEAFFLPDYDDGITADFETEDFEDKEFRLKEKEINLKTGFHSINEERAIDGEEPVPWGNLPWLPFSVMQPGQEVTKPKPSNGDGKQASLETKRLTRSFWTEERKDVYWKMFVRRSEHLEQLFLKAIRSHFEQQKEVVIRRLHSEGKKIHGQYAGWSRNRVRQHIGENKGIRDININKKEEEQALVKKFTPIARTIMKEAGEARMKDLTESMKAASSFDPNSDDVNNFLGAKMRKFSKEVSGTTFDEIERILKEGFVSEDPIPAITETLREKFDSWDQYRAANISRTETISYMNEADRISVIQSGLDDVLLKHWLSSRDAHVRPTHVTADQKYSEDGIAIDDEFEVGADRMQAPGGGSLPEEVCQ